MAENDGPNGPSRPNKPSGPRGPNSHWPEYVQFLFVVGLTVLFLMLAVTMRRHHFMRGELYQQSHPEDR
jgi:hypothetical protein